MKAKIKLGPVQRHILKWAASSAPEVCYTQSKGHERSADRLVKRGLLAIAEPKIQWGAPTYKITKNGLAAAKSLLGR